MSNTSVPNLPMDAFRPWWWGWYPKRPMLLIVLAFLCVVALSACSTVPKEDPIEVGLRCVNGQVQVLIGATGPGAFVEGGFHVASSNDTGQPVSTLYVSGVVLASSALRCFSAALKIAESLAITA